MIRKIKRILGFKDIRRNAKLIVNVKFFFVR